MNMLKDNENNSLNAFTRLDKITEDIYMKEGENRAILEASNIVLERTKDILNLITDHPDFPKVNKILLDMHIDILHINKNKKE